ncbi:MAG TPA: tetratricopeptide repeat protein, partial [Edaphobacter sp.]
MTGNYSDAQMLERIRPAYSSRPAPSTVQVLKTTVRLAAQRSNPCAEALSAFALGRLTQAANVAESRLWFERAEKSFAAAQSPTGLAHVHFALASSGRNTKSSAEVTASFAQVADEFERAGDAHGALTARIHAVDRKRSELQEVFGPLLRQAQQLGDPVIQAQIHHSWGDELFTRGHYNEATHQYQLSDDLYMACRCQYDQRAALQTSLGRIERIQGRAMAAIPHYRLALSLQQKADDQYLIPQTLNAISVAYESMGQYQHAIAYVQQALSIARAIHSQEFIDFLEANLGALYAKAGQPQRGLPLLQRATAKLANDYQRCTRYQQLADLYIQLKQPDEAEQAITQSIDACERDQSRRSLADGLETRAKIRAGSGSLEDALADARRSLTLIEEISAHVVPEDAHRRGYNQATLQT